jgi:hypothetical protein
MGLRNIRRLEDLEAQAARRNPQPRIQREIPRRAKVAAGDTLIYRLPDELKARIHALPQDEQEEAALAIIDAACDNWLFGHLTGQELALEAYRLAFGRFAEVSE